MKWALCVGIDNYPGTVNDLRCCVRDAKDWASFLGHRDFDVMVLLDEDATKYNILTALSNIAVLAMKGDCVVYTQSSHGTSVMDRSGDEPDGYDEAIFVYPNDIILDDELRAVLDKFEPGVHITVVADTCFSGTVTRMAFMGTGVVPPRMRYVQTDIVSPKAHRKKEFLQEEDMNHLLFAACGDNEYSYEGARNGVFTEVMLDILKDRPYLTNSELNTIVQQRLPTIEYPQTAHLEGPEKERNRIAFTDNDPTPPDPNDDDGWDWNKIIEFFRKIFDKICQIFRKGG